MKHLVCLIFLLAAIEYSYGQVPPTDGLVLYYSFDNCDAVNDFPTSGGQLNGTIFGNPRCVCGVSGQALDFDGMDDFVQTLGLENSTLKTGEFTISFYFKPTSRFGFKSLLSKRIDCGDDNAIEVSFVPSLNQIGIFASEDDGKQHNVEITEDLTSCWQHVIISREGNALSVYLNGTRILTDRTPSRVNLSTVAPFSLADSPCVGIGRQRFEGIIDEVRVYDRVLGLRELESLYIEPDNILNRDTIIFSGDQVDVRISATCATRFSWTPSAGVSSVTIAEPTLTPTETTLYKLFLSDNICTAQDSLRVIVVNEGEVDCDQLFFPTAFTPNDDGRNDLFGLSNAFAIEELIKFEVFGRWGDRIFLSSELSEKWDGSYRGSMLNPGVYYYRMEYLCDGQEKVKSGSVTLLK